MREKESKNIGVNQLSASSCSSSQMEVDLKIRDMVLHKLKPYMEDLNQYGGDYFTYRIFYSDGTSYGVSNYEDYYSADNYLLRNKLFWRSMSEYFQEELIRCYRNKGLLTYVPVISEDEDDQYLNKLDLMQLSNGIGLYEFLPDRVRYFFSDVSIILLAARRVIIY